MSGVALLAFSSEGPAVSGEAHLYVLQPIMLAIIVRCFQFWIHKAIGVKPSYTIGLPVE